MLLLLIIACFIIRGAPSAAPYVFARCSLPMASTVDTLLYPAQPPLIHGARRVREMSGQAQNQAQTNQVVCFEYRFTGMGARTEYIFLKVNGRIKRLEPLWTRRSKTGNHGMDCYTATFLRKADAEVVVQVSNSGKHYCSLKLYRQLSKEELLKLSKWLAENEHICEQIAMDLVKYGLPEDVLLDLVQRDP